MNLLRRLLSKLRRRDLAELTPFQRALVMSVERVK